MEEQINVMETTIKKMKDEMGKVKSDIEEMKKHRDDKYTTYGGQENGRIGKSGGWNAGGCWGKGYARTWETDWGEHDVDDGWKPEWSFAEQGRDDGGHQAQGESRRTDRRNEMVARGFARNTKWKSIKAAVEKVMNKTGVAYSRVQVIGEMNSFAFIKFDAYEHKQAFKRWLEQYGDVVKQEKGVWFGDNVGKDASEKARAVGKVKRA